MFLEGARIEKGNCEFETEQSEQVSLSESLYESIIVNCRTIQMHKKKVYSSYVEKYKYVNVTFV